MYKLLFKRLTDIILGLMGFILLSPLFIAVTVFLFFANKGKPFFSQARPGKNEKIFRLLKFKSMNDNKDENGELLPFDQRVTKVGLFIRKYSLDEIPQLINVILGQMSLVGPRPLLVKYLPLYNDFQKQRHNVKPGITGWAQVKGRNTISWEKKFELDVWYTENLSFTTDLKIILLTIKKVFFKEDINSGEGINMTPFLGNNNE